MKNMIQIMKNVKNEELVELIKNTFGDANPAKYLYFFGSNPNVEFEVAHVLQEFTNRKHTKMKGTINVVAGNRTTKEILCNFYIDYLADIKKSGEDYQISNIRITNRRLGSTLVNLVSCLIWDKCREENIKYLFDIDMKLLIAY